MSELSRFFGQDFEKEIVDEKGEKIKIRIPSLCGRKEVNELIKWQGLNKDPQSQAEAMKYLFDRIMRHNFPNITDDELDKISLNVMMQVMDGLAEANNLKSSDKEDLLKMKEDAERAIKTNT